MFDWIDVYFFVKSSSVTHKLQGKDFTSGFTCLHIHVTGNSDTNILLTHVLSEVGQRLPSLWRIIVVGNNFFEWYFLHYESPIIRIKCQYVDFSWGSQKDLSRAAKVVKFQVTHTKLRIQSLFAKNRIEKCHILKYSATGAPPPLVQSVFLQITSK